MLSLRYFSAWQIALCLFFLLLVFAEFGYWMGRRFRKSNESSQALGVVKGAVLALVGLLLGFSFSISSNRFEHRRELMLEEANAIGTAYLRGDLMEEPLRSRYKETLRDYLDSRISSFKTAALLNAQEWESIRKHHSLQEKIWGMGMSYVQAHPLGAASILLPNALNAMIDIGLKREAARLTEVPTPILCLLVFAVLLAAFFVGQSFGAAQDRNWIMTLLFCFLLSLVTFIIIDLDQPRRGLIQERQRAMEYLRSTMP